MSKIRHLAIKTKSPERLAKFYEQVFDMKVILTEKSGAIYMSDGYLTLAILKNRGDYTPAASIILVSRSTTLKKSRKGCRLLKSR